MEQKTKRERERLKEKDNNKVMKTKAKNSSKTDCLA